MLYEDPDEELVVAGAEDEDEDEADYVEPQSMLSLVREQTERNLMVIDPTLADDEAAEQGEGAAAAEEKGGAGERRGAAGGGIGRSSSARSRFERASSVRMSRLSSSRLSETPDDSGGTVFEHSLWSDWCRHTGTWCAGGWGAGRFASRSAALAARSSRRARARSFSLKHPPTHPPPIPVRWHRPPPSESPSSPPVLAAAFIHADIHTHEPALTVVTDVAWQAKYPRNVAANVAPGTVMPPVKDEVHASVNRESLSTCLTVSLESIIACEQVSIEGREGACWLNKVALRSSSGTDVEIEIEFATEEAVHHAFEVFHEIIQDNVGLQHHDDDHFEVPASSKLGWEVAASPTAARGSEGTEVARKYSLRPIRLSQSNRRMSAAENMQEAKHSIHARSVARMALRMKKLAKEARDRVDEKHAAESPMPPAPPDGAGSA